SSLSACKLRRTYLAVLRGSPPVTGSTSPVRASTSWGSFFCRGPARAGVANAVGRPPGQVRIQFLAAAADGIDMQAADDGEEGVAAWTDLLGVEGGEPAALLLVEPARQEVHLAVQLPAGVILAGGAVGALTLVKWAVGHDEFSVCCPRAAMSVYEGAGTNSP